MANCEHHLQNNAYTVALTGTDTNDAQHGFYAGAFGTPSHVWPRGLALVQSLVVQASFASFRAVS